MAPATKTKIMIKPLDDRVLIKPTAPEKKTTSGIYLPEGAKEKPITGKIVAVGPGKFSDKGNRTPLTVKKGDTVVFGKYSGTEVDIEDKQHTILRESELLGVMEK